MKILMYCLLALNVGVWLMYGIDKWKAKSGRWRIPEKVLLLAAFARSAVLRMARAELLHCSLIIQKHISGYHTMDHKKYRYADDKFCFLCFMPEHHHSC